MMGALPWPAWNDLTPYLSSGLLAPADEPGATAAGVTPPGRLPGLCPNCLVDLDADGYCSGCSYLAKVVRP